jgi:hypothetical protein
MPAFITTSPLHRRAAAWLSSIATLAAIGVIAATPQPAPTAGRVSNGPIAVETMAVPLNPKDPTVNAIGDFTYAGGVMLTSKQTDLLHELSDIVITGTDHVTAIGDAGIFFEARLTFDAAGRLAGVTDASIAPLIDENGKPLVGKSHTDAEGLALLPNGDRLVSFERVPRIWLYPKSGGPPHAVPSPPRARFPSNEGMEALTAAADFAPDAYIVGGEASGEIWICRVSGGCARGPTIKKPREYGLVALNRMPDGKTAFLLRAYDPVRHSRITLGILEKTTVIAQMNLAVPLTVDNFEGLTSVALDGGRRFYIVSDDNGSPEQRTLLLAFDWNPN